MHGGLLQDVHPPIPQPEAHGMLQIGETEAPSSKDVARSCYAAAPQVTLFPSPSPTSTMKLMGFVLLSNLLAPKLSPGVLKGGSPGTGQQG